MLAYVLVVFAVLLRLVPHVPDVTPLTGLALFGGVYLQRKQAIWLPLVALFVSDLFLPSEPIITRLSVYGSFCLIGLIGLVLRSRKNFRNVIIASLFSSTLFYVITNFAFLYPTAMYGHNWSGIMQSYTNALPFFRNAIIGDISYTSLLFGAYELMLRYVHLSHTVEKTDN
jgi:hypothetical protein